MTIRDFTPSEEACGVTLREARWPLGVVCIYRHSSHAARVFSRAKESLNLEDLHVRGLRSVSIWVNLVFTAMLAVAAARGNGLESQIKCIRSIFG